MQVCSAMKKETVSWLSYESRDCKFAYVWKWKLQVCLTMKIDFTSMLNYENGNCNMLSYEHRNYKYA